MTKEEIYNKANSVVGIDGMTGNERLWESGLMDEFDKAKKSDKYKARTILQALKFDELSIGRIVGFSMDSLKYPNAWDFPNENSNGQENENKATLEYSNLNEVGMGAPLIGKCKIKLNEKRSDDFRKLWRTSNLDSQWTKSCNTDLGQVIFWWNIPKNRNCGFGKTNAN